MDEKYEYNLGFFNHTGTKYGKLNQDFVVVDSFDVDIGDSKVQTVIAIVCDGHGCYGQQHAQIAASSVVKNIQQSKELEQCPLIELSDKQINQVFIDGFKQAQRYCLQLYSNPPSEVLFPSRRRKLIPYRLKQIKSNLRYVSEDEEAELLVEAGTTLTAVLIQGNHAVVANVGDSSAVLGRRVGVDNYDGFGISEPHTLYSRSEYQRIQALNSPYLLVNRQNGYIRVTKGPATGYELQLTRSIGHFFMSKLGIEWKPSIQRINLTKENCCVIVASDGVWGYLSSSEAARTVMEYYDGTQDAMYAAQQLCDEAVDLAKVTDGEADNTSCALIVFNIKPQEVA